MEHPDLVLARSFASRVEADLAHAALEAGGVDAVVVADDAGGQYSSLWMHGVRLLVRSEDESRALEILNSPLPD
jgi:hypothetical protein